MQVGLGFWASKTLLAATKLGLFTLLEEGARTPEQIQASLKLHGQNLLGLLDALFSLGHRAAQASGLSARQIQKKRARTCAVAVEAHIDKTMSVDGGPCLYANRNRSLQQRTAWTARTVW
jgi:hypothetical protein